MNLFGTTRTHVTRNHALIAPDGYVGTGLPGWTNVSAVTLISPQMGAAFVQTLIKVDSAGESAPPLPGVERFIYVVAGELILNLDQLRRRGHAEHGRFCLSAAKRSAHAHGSRRRTSQPLRAALC